MTKQEEIREGIAEELAKIPKGYIGITDPEWHERRLVKARVQARAVIDYLHSQGVVIKIEKELPLPKWEEVESTALGVDFDTWAKMIAMLGATLERLTKAGYVGTEPLIGEKE